MKVNEDLIAYKATICGKEYETYMKVEDWNEIINNLGKKTGYERVEQNKEYWCVCADGYPDDQIEEICNIDIKCYDAANYYSSKEVAENNARADKLMRQLRRFAVEHRKSEIDWSKDKYKYIIRYAHGVKDIQCGWEIKGQDFGGIWFDSEDVAMLAIETFYNELIWYFTEYKDSL